jgi:hypothetical protein
MPSLVVNFHSVSDPVYKTTSTGTSLIHTTSQSQEEGSLLVAILYTAHTTI